MYIILCCAVCARPPLLALVMSHQTKGYHSWVGCFDSERHQTASEVFNMYSRRKLRPTNKVAQHLGRLEHCPMARMQRGYRLRKIST